MAKTILTLKAEVVAKNERKQGASIGGNVLLAVGVEDTKEGQAARKTVNYQTMDAKELAAFTSGDIITITFEK